jgi:hypothetical protein
VIYPFDPAHHVNRVHVIGPDVDADILNGLRDVRDTLHAMSRGDLGPALV